MIRTWDELGRFLLAQGLVSGGPSMDDPIALTPAGAQVFMFFLGMLSTAAGAVDAVRTGVTAQSLIYALGSRFPEAADGLRESACE